MEDWQWIAIAVAVSTTFVYWFASRPRRERVKPPSPSVTKKDLLILEEEVPSSRRPNLPRLAFEDEDEHGLDSTKIGQRLDGWLSPPTAKIVYDEDAAIDEPTHADELIVVTAVGQTHKGMRRRRNEDRVLIRETDGLFVVADGMGGYRGGEVASSLAVKTIDEAFNTMTFKGTPHESIPKRASELARAIQMANHAILLRASEDKRLEGMGTTICAARFSRNKQRLYVGHVGDSRIYCLRDGKLQQMSSDHTMKDLGIQGEGAAHLSRAVGVWPTVPVDIILGKPRPGDLYMLCSDGLTKMVPHADIEAVLKKSSPRGAVAELIDIANARGGNDNITIVVVAINEARSPRNVAA